MQKVSEVVRGRTGIFNVRHFRIIGDKIIFVYVPLIAIEEGKKK